MGDCCNHERYHESLDNVTPANVYKGRGNDTLDRRLVIKPGVLMQVSMTPIATSGQEEDTSPRIHF